MDQAWKFEQHFWEELSEGRAAGFYARHMTSDGYVVLPTGVVERDQLIARWEQHEPLTYELSGPRLLLVEGNVLVPAHYDFLRTPYVYVDDLRSLPVIAQRDGKMGLVMPDGKETVVLDFIYDDIELRDEPPYFEAYAGEEKTLFDL